MPFPIDYLVKEGTVTMKEYAITVDGELVTVCWRAEELASRVDYYIRRGCWVLVTVRVAESSVEL